MNKLPGLTSRAAAPSSATVMTEPDLPPSEARAVIHRHVHDLRNIITCMDLEIHCLAEDPSALSCVPRLQKIRAQLALAEQGLRSLSVRFVEPSINIAAAADLFHHWRQHVQELGCGLGVRWEEPVCTAAITVDFNAVVAVLTEICLQTKPPAGPRTVVAAIAGEEGSVSFTVREPASEESYQETPPETQQWTEWQRMITISGGVLERIYDPVPAHAVMTLRFPAVVE